MSLSLHLRVRGPIMAVVAPLTVVATLLVGLSGSVPGAGAIGNCPNEAFRIGPSAALPDCRAYELVSPPDKNGGEVDGGLRPGSLVVAPEQAATDGEAVTYGSTSAFIGSDPESALVATQYLSTRTADGWLTRAITPTQEVPEGRVLTISDSDPDFSLFQGFNEDLSDGFLVAWTPQPDPSAPAGYFNPYLREAGSGGYQLLSTVTPPVQPPGDVELESRGFGVVYAGMSTDGQHVIFEANDALTPDAVPGQVNLYEWSAGRPLELVSVLPEGRVDTSGTSYPSPPETVSLKFGSPALSQSITPSLPFNYSGALSSDGRRAFWSGGSSGDYQVYMHEITESGSRTVDVSASQKSGEPDAAAHYWTANPEGSFAYFTSQGQLTPDSSAGPGGSDLYQYNTNTGALLDLTVDPNGGETANVLGVLGTGESESTPYVYFVATGRLTQGASAGVDNLYLWHGSPGGGPGVTTLIATLGGFEAENSNFAEPVMERTSRVSPDGRLLAFQSAEPLTGYDNVPANGEPCPTPAAPEGIGVRPYERIGGRCMEVFEYDAQSGTLACASCDPSGLPPTADSMVPEARHLLENLRGWESPTVQQRYLLNDGRLYFQSEDALLPEATNGRQNVYEYEPEGVGQCAGTGAGSCLYLISTGKSSGNSYFADASADGRDVFLLTDEQLVTQDGDEATDLYDAREGGGFSSVQPPPCGGEACKPAVTPAPAIYGAPSSAAFQGLGNLAAPPAAKSIATKKQTKRKPKKKTRHKAKRRTQKRRAGKSDRSAERRGR
jgi:hypothetical protein